MNMRQMIKDKNIFQQVRSFSFNYGSYDTRKKLVQGMAGFHNLELTVENPSDKTHGATNYTAELDEVTDTDGCSIH
jgi:hypothetical protein